MEGLLLGAAVGAGAWLASRSGSVRVGTAIAGAVGASAGVVITLLGGRLMLGSLELLAEAFPGSRLRLDELSRLSGETAYGPVTAFAFTTLEGMLFSACVVGAMMLARRRS
jgi:hypothetical protein